MPRFCPRHNRHLSLCAARYLMRRVRYFPVESKSLNIASDWTAASEENFYALESNDDGSIVFAGGHDGNLYTYSADGILIGCETTPGPIRSLCYFNDGVDNSALAVGHEKW